MYSKSVLINYLCSSMSALQKRILSFLLLTVFCLYVTPKEVFHAFSHHTDTEHHIVDTQGLHFDSEHHHCELLKLDQQFTAAQIDLPYFDFEQLPQYVDQQKIALLSIFRSNDANLGLFLRGPPATV